MRVRRACFLFAVLGVLASGASSASASPIEYVRTPDGRYVVCGGVDHTLNVQQAKAANGDPSFLTFGIGGDFPADTVLKGTLQSPDRPVRTETQTVGQDHVALFGFGIDVFGNYSLSIGIVGGANLYKDSYTVTQTEVTCDEGTLQQHVGDVMQAAGPTEPATGTGPQPEVGAPASGPPASRASSDGGFPWGAVAAIGAVTALVGGALVFAANKEPEGRHYPPAEQYVDRKGCWPANVLMEPPNKRGAKPHDEAAYPIFEEEGSDPQKPAAWVPGEPEVQTVEMTDPDEVM